MERTLPHANVTAGAQGGNRCLMPHPHRRLTDVSRNGRTVQGERYYAVWSRYGSLFETCDLSPRPNQFCQPKAKRENLLPRQLTSRKELQGGHRLAAGLTYYKFEIPPVSNLKAHTTLGVPPPRRLASGSAFVTVSRIMMELPTGKSVLACKVSA